MSFLPGRDQRKAQGLLCGILAFISLGCLFKTHKTINSRGEGASLFDRKSFVITRTDGGTTAIIQFAAGRPVMCNFEIYAQQPDIDPKESSPLKADCLQQPTENIKEKIAQLAPTLLYFFRVRAWTPDSVKEKGEVIVVKEPPFTSDATVLIEPDGRFKDVMVARLSLAQRTSELHRHTFPNATSQQELQAMVSRKQGCQSGPPPLLGDLGAADSDIRATNIASRGFATASAQPHINYRERAKLMYNALQFADRWEWIFDIFGKTQNFFSKAPSRLEAVEISSANTIALQSSRLRGETQPSVTLDPTRPLQVKWRTADLIDPAAFVLQIGGGKTPNSFHCVFDSGAGQGTIDTPYLGNLPNGKHHIVATLESHQILITQNTGAWLISGNDFKSGQLER